VAQAIIRLAPQPDTDWARSKCGLKLLLYIACGLPAIASRVGVHAEIVSDDEDGVLVESHDAFEFAVDRLIGDPALRARLGSAARATVEGRYSVRAVGPRLAGLLQRAADG